ncbi:MAG: DUF1684 domain-containing protein [Cyclobacteriaceae bacterium]|nr:DUF1684 domain-containing protein [Cyclobacteriaceae bacterium]
MKQIIIGSVVLFCSAALYWFLTKEENPQQYLDNLSIHRHDQVEFFRFSLESPFLQQKINFSYLNYYTADLNYRIEAVYKKRAKQDTLSLATSTGTIDKFLVVGTANFKWQETDNTLLVLASTQRNDPTLFIPFLDKTSGEATYGGGRYLDVQPAQRGKILLDFNKAYNPYCAYMEGYTCPFPPKENRLAVAIVAGEKSFPEH